MDVQAAALRVQSSRSHANEIVGLLEECSSASRSSACAAMKACRCIFETWIERGEFSLSRQAADETTDGDAALSAFRQWLRDKYRRFVTLLGQKLQAAQPSQCPEAAMDALLLLAVIEVRHSKPGHRLCLEALDVPGSALRELVNGIVCAPQAQPKLLERLHKRAMSCLDISYFVSTQLQRLAKRQAGEGASSDRIVDMLALVTPPTVDVSPEGAQFLTIDSEAKSSWPTAALALLRARQHRREFCKAWRAVMLRPLAAPTRRRMLALLPDVVLPHVPRPLQYCDFLSDSFAGGGVEALLALKGLFFLMQRHNLEYPSFYQRLYALLSVEALCGPHRAQFARELELFLSSLALPAYLLAAFAKKLARIALLSTPVGAALACALVFNLMLTHPAVRVLIHRPGSHTSSEDPFVEAADDPAESHALDSSLWEIDTLSSHFSPTVASLAKLFATPFTRTTSSLEVDTFSNVTTKSFIKVEAGKRMRQVPTNKDPPRALFKPGLFV